MGSEMCIRDRVSDYAAMDRLLREERKHVLGLCKKIKKCGITVLLIQKSILRDAYNDLSLHFLAKSPCHRVQLRETSLYPKSHHRMGIMVVADIERNDISHISETLDLLPVAHVNYCVQIACDEVTRSGVGR